MRSTSFFLLLLGVYPAVAAPVPVTVDAKLGMRLAGQPYFVKGTGGETEFERLAARGANSIRSKATDPEGDPLAWTWSVLPKAARHEPGKKPPMPAAIPYAVIATHANEATVQAPAKPGIYRLHVWISDGKGHAATANTPFDVKDFE